MRVFNQLVFDEWILTGTGVTSDEFGTTIGRYDALAIQVITESIDVAGTITVQLQHAADGKNFINKNGTAEITGAGTGVGKGGLSLGITNVNWGFDNGVTPSLSFQRLLVAFTTTGRGRVQIYVTARDTCMPDPLQGKVSLREPFLLVAPSVVRPATAEVPRALGLPRRMG